jgi:hypothetical protein
MSEMMTAKINVSKVEKARLFEGKNGKYIDIVLIPTPNSQYGDYIIKQQCTKEERERKLEMPIIGNAKFLDRTKSSKPTPKAEPCKPDDSPPEADDVPF